MRTKEEVLAAIDAAILKRKAEIGEIAETVWKNPEPGYREVKTLKLASKVLRSLGLEVKEGLAMTGLRADLDTGRPGPTIAILGEMDSLILPSATDADPETGAFHACGHHTHITSMLGAAMGLIDSGAANELCGKIAFIGTPAEESIELDYRCDLIAQGKISALGGKQQLIREGVFDDVDAAMMIHITSYSDFVVNDTNGFVKKLVQFHGKSSHAADPGLGVNSFHAATLALDAIALMREIFPPAVRIHGLMSKCGDAINIIPELTQIDYQIRGDYAELYKDVAKKFDNAMYHCAAALGATATIRTLNGYMPNKNDPDMAHLICESARRVHADKPNFKICEKGPLDTGCTDMGDVCAICPGVQAFAKGAIGGGHTKDYRVPDAATSSSEMARVMAGTAVDLLFGDAELGKKMAEKKKTMMTREEYVKWCDDISAGS